MNRLDIPTQADVHHFFEFKNVYIPQIKCKAGLLIGNDNRMVLQPQEIVKKPSGSYAIRTVVGWAVNCPGRPGSEHKHLSSFFVKSSGGNQPMCSLWTDIMDSLINVKEKLSVDQPKFIDGSYQFNQIFGRSTLRDWASYQESQPHASKQQSSRASESKLPEEAPEE